MKRLTDYLTGLKMTIISGIFLATSLILMLTNTAFPIDPAWITIFISGLLIVLNAALLYDRNFE